MKYVKSCLIITMLLGVQIGYSQCNESNWQDYYPNMGGCDLSGANLSGANLSGAYCYGAFFVGANLEGTIFDGAFLQYTYFDENEDEYDDASYDAGEASIDTQSYYDAGAESGDLNLDGGNDILDVVLLMNNILNS